MKHYQFTMETSRIISEEELSSWCRDVPFNIEEAEILDSARRKGSIEIIGSAGEVTRLTVREVKVQ